MRRALRVLALAALLAPGGGLLRAQSPDTSVVLPEVHVEATRTATGTVGAPYGVAARRLPPAAHLIASGGGLAPLLRTLPGLFLSSRENPALGERLVVRGMGARSAFGVRGVQVVLDGIPLSLPDGQAVLNVVDAAFVREAVLVRGPASALWGNASGGVLLLSTLPSGRTGGSAHVTAGSDGYRRVEAGGVVPVGRGRAGLVASHARSDGYRDHSRFEAARARAFADWVLAPGALLRVVAAAERTPRQQHPGALTRAEHHADPRRAEARYVHARAGKSSHQVQGGASLVVSTAPGTWTTTVFGQVRRLDNPLPFAYIDLDRRAGGLRTAFEATRGALGWTAGVDAGVQHDVRANTPNDGGRRGTPRTLDQTETVRQGAVWARLRWEEAAGFDGLHLEGAVRADRIAFRARDALLADGDQSGTRTLTAVSPMLGVAYAFGAARAFVSWATAFETPTTTELANRPDGAGGFNPDLAPQRTRGLEAGLRGTTATLAYDVAVYAMRVRDGLVPFEGAGGRTYYRNAQQTRHAGVEVAASWAPPGAFSADATYAYARLRFGGTPARTVPGVPPHRLVLAARVRRAALHAEAVLDARAAYYADDANTARIAPSAVVDAGVAYTLASGPVAFTPYVRVANVLDTHYVGSAALNARGGRYYEPAAGRQVFAGVRVGW